MTHDEPLETKVRLRHAIVFAELKRLAGKMPMPQSGLTDKNKGFLRQFDDPAVLQRACTISRTDCGRKSEGKLAPRSG